MTDREAMLRAIAANPDEDTPRLIYADLLDELGGEVNVTRARFIRIQIDLFRNPSRSWFANSDRLCEIARLAGLFADKWLDELPKWARKDASKLRLRADDFSRGFLETFIVNPMTFSQHGGELLEVAPITHLVVPGPSKGNDLGQFLCSEFLLRIRSLSLTNMNGNLVTSEIRASWELGNLGNLNLSGCGLTDAGAIALTQARKLQNLQVLTAHGNSITEAGAARLMSATKLPRLKRLDIRGAPYGWQWVDGFRSRFPGKEILVY